MNIEVLNNILSKERTILEKCWSNITAYPKVKIWKKCNKSKGQCFVTSMHLIRFIEKEIKEGIAFINRGIVKSIDGAIIINDHCWIEIHSDLYCEPLIIDITVDQSKKVNKKVLLNFKNQITIKYKVNYITNKVYSQYDLQNLDENTKMRYLSLTSKYNNFILNRQHD